jgi:hypothetical protein
MIPSKIIMESRGGNVWWGGGCWRIGGEGADLAVIAAKDAGNRVGAGANMRLIRVEECYLNVESRNNFSIEYIRIFYL